jgi:hypothetical protein
VTRDVPVHDGMHLEFIAEAFNLMNHTIISSVNTAFATQLAPTAPTGTCPAAPVPTGSQFAGCIVPFVSSTPSGAFGVRSTTNNALYGPRQLQLSGKFFF